MTSLTAENSDVFFPRHFRGGLRFKTLCRDCNSRLGGREDKALAGFFEQVRKLIESPIVLGTPVIQVAAKPNLIFRGLLAHLASANDSGMPCPFDAEARAARCAGLRFDVPTTEYASLAKCRGQAIFAEPV